MEKEHDTYELRQEYERFRKKHQLPDFTELNKLFDIEEIEEGEFLLRKIRRTISEKIGGYLRFVETILNPSTAPMFFFKLIKKLENEDRTTLAEIYEKLGNSEVEALSLDLDYDEKKEAEFINKIYNLFQKEVKNKLAEIIKKLNTNGDNNHHKESSYCG